MIQMQTRLESADNTGVKELQCIKVLGGTHRRTAGLGDVIAAGAAEHDASSHQRNGVSPRKFMHVAVDRGRANPELRHKLLQGALPS